MSEIRTGKRFPLTLPVRLAGKDGVTRNISAAGVFLYTDSQLQIGSEVEFELTLPAAATGGPSDIAVHCRGRVVRVEPVVPQQVAKPGVACVIDQYKIVRDR